MIKSVTIKIFKCCNMHCKNLLFVFAFSLLAFHVLQLNAQQPTIEWVRRWNSQYNSGDQPREMILDKFNNIIVTGSIFANTQGNDIATVKYSSTGFQQWAVTYNYISNTNDLATGITTDSSGNIFVTGTTGFNLGPYDIITIKYNNSGIQQWAKIYAGSAGSTDDYACDIAVDRTGNIYVCGGTGTPVGPADANGNAFLVKYNSDGDSIWVRRYSNGNYFASYSSIAIDNLNNIYAAGTYAYYFPPDIFRFHALTVKYDSNGVLLWAKQYISIATNHDYLTNLALDSSRNVYVTGSSYGQGIPSSYTTIKYTSSGEQQWVKNYSRPNGNSYAAAINTDKLGNAYVTGDSYRISNIHDIATIKYNSNGDSIWVKRYTGPDNNGGAPMAMKIDDSANIYITGNTNSGITTLKYTTNGFQQWVASYPGQSADIVLDNLRNIYVTGMNTDSGNGFDYVTIKYTQPLGIDPVSYQIPNDYKLYQNYPNPFNNQSLIKFQVPKFSNVKLIVYDILGRKVTALVDQQLAPGTYNINWNADNLSSGVYYYRLYTDGFINSKCMILAK